MRESQPRQSQGAPSRANQRSAPGARASARPGDFLVVGIGASAGGLEACRKFVDALPARNGMAFILVQHLDPTHESMMVDLLGGHTSMNVRQATDGMLIERDHLYVIPPGTYLSVSDGALRISQPQARHGARLPFDFLLHSLAEEYDARAVCVVLSGTGADGSLGLKAVKEKCGLIIAQDPDEAGYDGMPRSAIATGAVDLVLPVAKIPEAGAVVVGGLSALGAALYSSGTPKDSVVAYESALKADKFLVTGHDPVEEMARAKEILGTLNPSRLDLHAGVKALEPDHLVHEAGPLKGAAPTTSWPGTPA